MEKEKYLKDAIEEYSNTLETYLNLKAATEYSPEKVITELGLLTYPQLYQLMSDEDNRLVNLDEFYTYTRTNIKYKEFKNKLLEYCTEDLFEKDFEKYKGKRVRFKGIAATDNSLPNSHFAVGRHIMTCCADDIACRGVVAKGMCGLKVKTRDWLVVEGVLDEEYSKLYRGVGPVLYVKAIERAEKPIQEVATFY